MAVLRIVPNLAEAKIGPVRDFYQTLFGLEIVMDQGWISTLGTGTQQSGQISIASDGGSGTAVPDLSIEVDDLDTIHARAVAAGYPLPYPPTTETWGVRRFFVEDPSGRLLNILSHCE